jgi:histidine ammonia-lyase/tyrosine ammonia-lyase
MPIVTGSPGTLFQLGHTVLEPVHLEQASAPMRVQLDAQALARLADCHRFVQECMHDGRAVYGATTGLGPLAAFPGRQEAADQCENVLAHLGAGQGPDLEPAVVRATMLIRLVSLGYGRSGVSPEVVECLAAALGSTFAPAVPRFGSLGASGDLIPLAALVSALRGRGRAYVDGECTGADEALCRAGLKPMQLAGRDALALVNGTSVTLAAAGLALASLERSRKVGTMLSALLADVVGAPPRYLSSSLLSAFGHADSAAVGAELREHLEGLVPATTRSLQEPYSIRCVPQLVGAVRSAIRYVDSVVRDDLDGVSDNPLFFPERDEVAHGGNFFGQHVSFAADLLSLVATQLGNLAERQLDLLIDPGRNGGLPPMLSVDPGRQHAVQGMQLTATALVAHMRRSATPASIQSLPTNWHNQDVIPFGTQAALNALDQARWLRLLHGSLAVALRQAVHVSDRGLTAPACVRVMEELAAAVDPIIEDRSLDEDVRRAADVLDRIAARPLGSRGPRHQKA